MKYIGSKEDIFREECHSSPIRRQFSTLIMIRSLGRHLSFFYGIYVYSLTLPDGWIRGMAPLLRRCVFRFSPIYKRFMSLFCMYRQFIIMPNIICLKDKKTILFVYMNQLLDFMRTIRFISWTIGKNRECLFSFSNRLGCFVHFGKELSFSIYWNVP